MTVARALQLWPYLEATGLQLSSPGVTSSATGTAWLASFMAQAKAQGLAWTSSPPTGTGTAPIRRT